MTPETIGVTVTFKEPVTFHLRLIGIQEEHALRQKMFGLTDEERAEKAYQNNVDMLADLSEEMPSGMFPSKPATLGPGTQPIFIENFKTAKEAVKAYFAEKSVVKERVAEFAVRGYFVKLQPDVDFS